MPLDPQVTKLLAMLANSKIPPLETMRPAVARKAMTTRFLRARQAVGMLVPPEPVAQVEDRPVPVPDGEVLVRIYSPEGDGPHPALVFFHGGGFVLGSLDSHDDICRAVANATPCVVVSVQYRLAPEHRFPTGLEDAYAATAWVFDHAEQLALDPARIAVGGDSAGGNLATVIAHLAHERGAFRPCAQLLLYPATDLASESPSVHEFGQGYYLTAGQLRYYREHYVESEAELRNPLVSPLYRADLRHLPPAHIITAEFDPLRDEGEAYAHRLQEAGVPVTLKRYDGMIHGFLSMSAFLEQARVAVADISTALRTAFRG